MSHMPEKLGMYSFCQLMTASMPTFIGRNITAIRPTHDCFYANLGHIMTAFMPTIGQIVWLQKVNLSLLFCQLYLTSWWYHCLHANSSWIIYLLWTHLLILNYLAGHKFKWPHCIWQKLTFAWSCLEQESSCDATDYGHMKTKSLILCSLNSNLNPK